MRLHREVIPRQRGVRQRGYDESPSLPLPSPLTSPLTSRTSDACAMRPLGRCAGLQLDDPELGLTPGGVAGGDT